MFGKPKGLSQPRGLMEDGGIWRKVRCSQTSQHKNNWIIVWMGSDEQRQKEQKESLNELSRERIVGHMKLSRSVKKNQF